MITSRHIGNEGNKNVRIRDEVIEKVNKFHSLKLKTHSTVIIVRLTVCCLDSAVVSTLATITSNS